ncbi:MAG: arginine--tRNA ligase [Bdellovibrionota bacterium]|jgi:arginyl-tRNA synthetase
MSTIISHLRQAFTKAIQDTFHIEIDPQVVPAQKVQFGDYQANFAMSLAKDLSQKTGEKKNPRELASAVINSLDLSGVAESVEVAGAGFINIRLLPSFVSNALQSMRADERLNVESITASTPTIIDYSGPNTAKEMHVGHLRSTNIGDAISRVLEFLGDNIIRQNHVGDWGTQFGMLLQLMQEESANPSLLKDLESFYQAAKKRFDSDPAFADRARAMVVKLQSNDETANNLWRKIVEVSREHYESVYARMDIKLSPEDERGESFYNNMLGRVASELQEKEIAFEDAGALIAKVEAFEAPLIIRKSDGGYGYDTTDLAAIKFRTNFLKAKRIIYLSDARQTQHFQSVFDIAKRAGWADNTQLDHVPFGMVMGKDGTPFKTRDGGTVKLNALLNEAEERALKVLQAKMQERGATMNAEDQKEITTAVGIGAIKYQDLNRTPIANYVFDFDQMLSFEGNTAPYLQYAFARICSIFDKNQVEAPTPETSFILETPQEKELARHLLLFSDTLLAVAKDLKPHILCTYLYDLAVKFSSFYEHCPVLRSEGGLRDSRLALSDLSARVLAQGLDLLGIKHPRQL